MRSEEDSPHVTAKNEQDSWIVITWKGEDSRYVIARNEEGSWLVIASPEGAKQSHKENCRGLIHQTHLSHLLYEIATLRSQRRIATSLRSSQ
jgi:hypothetical protein